MKVSIKKLPKSQIQLEIELAPQEFDEFLEKTTFELGKDLEIPGFRKGKVPQNIIEKEIGKEKILFEAAQNAIKETYVRAILENEIEAISQPEIKILKLAPGNPFLFQAIISVLPEITLPDYRGIASQTKRRKIVVSEREVEDALLWLQKSRAKFIEKNEPAQKGDFIEIEFSSPQIEQNAKKQDNFILGQGGFVPGFEENLVNMTVGQEKEFSVKFPEKHFKKELAGKKIHFKVKVKSVQKIILPKLDDEFAKNVGRFENLEALKNSIQEGLKMEKENRESQRLRQEILEKILRETKVEIPEILLENEKKRMLEDFKKTISERFKTSFEDYLKEVKKTEKEILETFSSSAERKIKYYLCLREIAKREKIEVSQEEIKFAINGFLKSYPSVEKAEKELDLEKLKSYYKEAIRNEKTLKFLEQLASNISD
jgi:trigger factor